MKPQKPQRWSRVVMDQECRRLIDGLGPDSLDVLEISGTAWRDRGFGSYRSASFPEYDVCSGPLDGARDSYDLVIAEQVFEHVLWPYRAGRNVHAMLRGGGAFLITTPFLNKVHNYPVDCSRWTELGLKHLLAECGFPLENTLTGSWGNRSCVKENLDRWLVDYDPTRHSLENEPAYPYHVWAIAHK